MSGTEGVRRPDCHNDDVPTPSPDPLASLAVVVVNFGTHALVEPNLLRSVGPDFPGSVVVVDSFSDGAERRAAEQVCARHGWTFVALEENPGFGAGNNAGAEAAIARGATELLLLNPDAWLEPDAVRRLQEQVQEDAGLLLAPRVLRPHGGLYADENDVYLDNGEMLWTHLRPEGVAPGRLHTWVTAACVALSVELWRACGGFDDDYFLYWEDVDLSRRVVDVGGRVAVDGSLSAVHDEGGSQRSADGPRRKTPTYFYYNTRNRLVYAAKHLSREDQRRWVRATPRASYRFAKQAGRRRFFHPAESLWPAFQGTRDGLRYLRRARRAP